MDSSAVSTALVTIGDHFNDFMHIQWVVLAYMLTYLGRLDHPVLFCELSSLRGLVYAWLLKI